MRAASRVALLALSLALAIVMWDRLLDRLIFQPSRGPELELGQLGLEGEELFLRTEDGVRIRAFFLPASGASRALLFLHGNAGNASHRLPNAAELVRLGAHVLLPEYRGYGRSEGSPSEDGVYADARAALSHLVEVRGVPESSVVVFGRSLGGAVAVDLAQDRPLAGLILESTFSSAGDVARSLLGAPGALLAGERFASDRKIGRVRCPILFFHGDRDQVIRPELGRRLFERAPGPKAFESIPGAGHNDTIQVGGPPYFARIRRFLDEVVPARETRRPGPARSQVSD